MKTLIVNEKYDNKKLINFIKDSFPELSLNVLNFIMVIALQFISLMNSYTKILVLKKSTKMIIF